MKVRRKRLTAGLRVVGFEIARARLGSSAREQKCRENDSVARYRGRPEAHPTIVVTRPHGNIVAAVHRMA